MDDFTPFSAIVVQVKASYRFDITGADNSSRSWVVDLKSGEGSVKESGDKADCIITIKVRAAFECLPDCVVRVMMVIMD